MKRWASAAVVVLGWAAQVWATPPATLTSLRAIHNLDNAQAGESIPVSFEATVTYYVRGDVDLFVQDGDVAIYVEMPKKNFGIVPGDRVLVAGHTRASYRPDILASQVTVLGHGEMPQSFPATFSQLIRSELDCRRVTVKAVVRSANPVQYGRESSTYLELLMDGGYIDASIMDSNPAILNQLLDAEVEITGAASGKFDSRSQLTGIVLEVPSFSGLKILRRAVTSLDSLPVTPMDDILKGYSVSDRTQRVKVHGTITWYQPGSAVVLQEGSKSLWVSTLSEESIRVGDLADATGFPDTRDGSLSLTHAEVQDRGVAAAITPLPVSWSELASGAHAFDLVSVEGLVVTGVRQADRDEYVMVAGGRLFSAIFRHADDETGVPLPPMRDIPAGSRVRVTGVSIVSYGSDPFLGPVSFDVLLRSPEDLAVVAGPSLLSVGNLIIVVVLLLLAAGVAGGRGWFLERKIRQQTAAAAERTEFEAGLERRRSHILEDINGSRPLAEILEEISEMTSLTLGNAPCWMEIADGTRRGWRPSGLEGFRAASEPIPSRCGPALGELCVAFSAQKAACPEESEALRLGARLASLAIETRKLFSDLVRRSEFDLLTDAHNRFSLDRQLEACIAVACQQETNFGLIYVDLDEFKQVNDQYGHRMGDLYLQEVASRMKRQLRAGDILARLGGDEFAALMPVVGSRANVEEIAMRLERSFDEPFQMEGYTLRGSASVGIAFYPEDGTTRDSLLSAADAAMYVTKHTREAIDEELAGRKKISLD